MTDPPKIMKKIEVLLATIEAVEASEDEQEAIEATILNISELGYPNIMISLLDRSTKPAKIRAVQAFGDEWEIIKEETVRDYPGKDLLAKVLERKKAKYIPDSRIDRETDKKTIEMSGIVSQYVIPLFTENNNIGTMQIHMDQCEAKPELACKMLDALGTHLSLAISRFRAIDRLNEANIVITEYSRGAIANEVATSMIHQLHHQIGLFDKKLSEELKQPINRQNSLVYKILTGLQKELSSWREKVYIPLAFMKTEEKQVCSLNFVVSDTLKYWYDHIHAKKCNLKYSPCSENVTVEIFPFYIREVLSCLIVNALQAHAKRINISIEKSMEYCADVRESCAVLRIADNGDGIPPDFSQKIFEHGFTTKRKIGSGLGMFIVKRLVEEMSGEVVLESGGKSAHASDTIFKIIIPAE